ncbi:LOW QUALITY PROTEIN: hypothetical protein N665_0308s0010 [Sinapis alba]|nr:LOW QUALITY PROTEIN: hypothetical protein N665_0308s0010 [Sinapis alba]
MSRCGCGKLMNEEVSFSKVEVVDNIKDGVFYDLKVAVRSTDLVLRKLKSVGCGDFSKVVERLVDIGLDEVMTLLECIFSSNAPLTDTFLNKQSPKRVMKTCNTPSPHVEKGIEAGPEELITFSAIFSCCSAAICIEYICSIFGCIGNLFKSFKDLSATEVSTSKALLPHYYRCQKQLLNIITENPQPLIRTADNEPVVVIDPKSRDGDQATKRSGFVKRDAKFTVADDLIITPMNSRSALYILKKLESQAEDLEVQEISISKTQAASLLRASLMTSSALNAALWNSTSKKPKRET